MKDTETKKAVSMTTTIAIAILATALVFPTKVAIAQSSGNDFQEFMECLFNDVGGSTPTAQDIESADVTEQEIRDCFSPIYNDASGDNTGSSSSNDDYSAGTSDSNNNSYDEENTDNTEGDDTTDSTDSTDSTDTNDDTEDTTSGNPDDPDSGNDGTDSSPQ